MRTRWILCLVMAASFGLSDAQTIDSTTQLLLDRAMADRDIFGAGRPDGFSLETQVQKTNSDFQLQITEDKWIQKENSDPNLLGTRDGAEMYFKRTLRGNGLAVTGTILKQISILNTNKSSIVTDYLIQVNDVLYSKQTFNINNGSTLIIAREGGRVHINGHSINIRVADFPPFVTGQTYILILRPSHLSSSFLIDSENAFAINGDDIRAAHRGRIHPAHAFMSDKETFVAAIRKFGSEVGK